MLDALRQRTVARGAVREHHGEAWSIRPEAAARMRPAHPAAASYAARRRRARRARLRGRPRHAAGRSTDGALAGRRRARDRAPAATQVGAHGRRTRRVFSADGDRRRRGVRGRAAAASWCSARTRRTSTAATSTSCWRPSACASRTRPSSTTAPGDGVPRGSSARPAPEAADPGLLHRVGDVGLLPRRRAGHGGRARRASCCARARPPTRPAPACSRPSPYGDGRVVVAADSDLFGDDYLRRRDHRQLWLNLVYWVVAGRVPRRRRRRSSRRRRRTLRGCASRTRPTRCACSRSPRARSTWTAHDAGEVRALVVTHGRGHRRPGAALPAPEGLPGPGASSTCSAWVEGGCGKPDFRPRWTSSGPNCDRRDGVEHLVVFPMYTPNGSPDTRFEALIMRTPWPEFVDQHRARALRQRQVRAGAAGGQHGGLRQRVRRALPRDGQRGRAADQPLRRDLLRPRVVAVPALRRSRAPRSCASTCRRTRERSRRSADLALETYILWDMIHDRWHSHGDLPFDPFMIRQRLPYWMYSLEELRVDLATYGTRRRAGARRVPLRALRAVRDPVRPHPALPHHRQPGAQLRRARRASCSSAFLHDRGVVRWTDNRLADRLGAGRRRGRRAARAGRGALPARHRHRARSRTGSPRTTWCRGT